MAKTKSAPRSEIIPIERIAASIYVVRGQKIMLDADLAVLYGVETKVFNQAVRRNIERFPEDFMFQLAPDEASALRSQFVTLESLSRCLLLSTMKYSIVLFTMSDQICYQENLTM